VYLGSFKGERRRKEGLDPVARLSTTKFNGKLGEFR